MTALFALLANPVARWAFAIGGAALAVTIVYQVAYWKGYFNGRAAHKAQIERQIQDAVRKGDRAREEALRNFDALPPDVLPDDGFRRD